ncbi:MAG TPA: ribonuclease R [Methyloprofundus sp.]|uniref:ribonuclease R n=1 Tax=Methyloprofundus sp. TaxID=2020875 RepID=UPI0017C6E2B1|nr:ribonuclease R [Methyloprofundus sp.]HIG66122.1 ribonuclease R [Methyloprofundus sp.]HIL78765.1 ribonuclease R [Methylococcales bacterium]
MSEDSENGLDFSTITDPYAQREAEKYEQPIPSRELILQLLEKGGRPTGRKQIAEAFALESDDQLEALRRRLRAMERDGQLLFNRRQQYCLVDSHDLIPGRILSYADGFGFLKPDDAGEDLFLSPREMNRVLHNDRALVRVSGVDRKGRREGKIVEVLERNTQQVVGRFIKEHGVQFVQPDNKKITQNILIPKGKGNGAKKGEMVVATIIEQPTMKSQPIGKIAEVLGAHMAPGMEIDVAIRTYDLPSVWPDAVAEQIKPFKKVVAEDAKQGRVDLRNVPLVTIDGADARDFDDAVFCSKTPNGWKLLVAIADVSHYVQPGSALDIEAKNRSTSVYFPEQVIPMLPEILSNGLCSINPDEERLCMVCEMLINEQGQVTRAKFFEAVMRSHARLTYDKVSAMLEHNNVKLRKKYNAVLPHLEQMYALYKAMRGQREIRGAMDFDTQETQIVFAEDRKIDKIIPVQRNDAHKLIEEFMIAANSAAARYLNRKKMPRLLRIHEGPSEEKIRTLKTFLGEVGLHMGGGDKPTPVDYMHLTSSIKDRPDAHLIQTVLLRSMSQAVYSPEKKGHFGLALEAYTHFTSPIRRYPDLMVHRAIRHCLQGKSPESFYCGFPEITTLGEHCSANERRADEATRDVVSWLKCEYMQDKIGESFAGVISAVTGFGFFVELSDLYVEGLVHVTSLGQDFFKFDPTSHQLKGERSGVRYRLGDSVNVIVASVNLDDKKIDFDLLGMERRGATQVVEKRPKKSGHDDKKKRRKGKNFEFKKSKSKAKSHKKGV